MGHHRHQRKTRKKLRWRLAFLAIAVVYSLVMIIQGTYAWVTYGDERINRSQTKDMRMELTLLGDYSPQILNAHYSPEKNVRVRNDQTTPAIVRVSLEEAMLAFEIDYEDKTGNANIKKYNQLTGTPIVPGEIDTWAVGRFYQKDTEISKAVKMIQKGMILPETNRAGLLNWVLPQMPHVLLTLPQVGDPVQDHFWFYQEETEHGVVKGYFYYSEVLLRGEVTRPLVTTIKQAPLVPNEIKGSLYHLDVNVNGGLASHQMLLVWGQAMTSDVSKMLSGKLLD